MKVFLSWSGDRSKAVAEALHDWLPKVIQVVEPWLANADIHKGARWAPHIWNSLAESKVGIVCLTSDNLVAPWILFEAGALANAGVNVCTLLLDIKETEVQEPLSQFQATLCDKDDMRKLVETIRQRVREIGEMAPSDKVIAHTFESFWPDLEQRVTAARAAPHTSGAPKRKADEILDEILLTVRRLESERRNEIAAEIKRDDDMYNELVRSRIIQKLGQMKSEGGYKVKPEGER